MPASRNQDDLAAYEQLTTAQDGKRAAALPTRPPRGSAKPDTDEHPRTPTTRKPAATPYVLALLVALAAIMVHPSTSTLLEASIPALPHYASAVGFAVIIGAMAFLLARRSEKLVAESSSLRTIAETLTAPETLSRYALLADEIERVSNAAAGEMRIAAAEVRDHIQFATTSVHGTLAASIGEVCNEAEAVGENVLARFITAAGETGAAAVQEIDRLAKIIDEATRQAISVTERLDNTINNDATQLGKRVMESISGTLGQVESVFITRSAALASDIERQLSIIAAQIGKASEAAANLESKVAAPLGSNVRILETSLARYAALIDEQKSVINAGIGAAASETLGAMQNAAIRFQQEQANAAQALNTLLNRQSVEMVNGLRTLQSHIIARGTDLEKTIAKSSGDVEASALSVLSAATATLKDATARLVGAAAAETEKVLETFEQHGNAIAEGLNEKTLRAASLGQSAGAELQRMVSEALEQLDLRTRDAGVTLARVSSEMVDALSNDIAKMTRLLTDQVAAMNDIVGSAQDRLGRHHRDLTRHAEEEVRRIVDSFAALTASEIDDSLGRMETRSQNAARSVLASLETFGTKFEVDIRNKIGEMNDVGSAISNRTEALQRDFMTNMTRLKSEIVTVMTDTQVQIRTAARDTTGEIQTSAGSLGKEMESVLARLDTLVSDRGTDLTMRLDKLLTEYTTLLGRVQDVLLALARKPRPTDLR